MPSKYVTTSPSIKEKAISSKKTIYKKQTFTSNSPFSLKVTKLGGKLLGYYINDFTLVICSCSKGHVFPIVPRSLLRDNQWCQYCIRSKGEEEIEKALQELGLYYIFNYHLSSDNSYPFYFEDKERRFLIVYNSLEETSPKDVEDIPLRRKARKEEQFKINLALSLGYKVIPLDIRKIKNVRKILLASI